LFSPKLATTFKRCINIETTTLFQPSFNIETTTLFQPHFNVEIITSVQLSNTTIFQRWCVTIVSTLIQRCCACWDSIAWYKQKRRRNRWASKQVSLR